MDDAGMSKLEAAKASGQALIREQALVAGEWVDGDGRIEVEDPAEETVIGFVPKLSAGQVEAAIKAAADVFPAWSGLREFERAGILSLIHISEPTRPY